MKINEPVGDALWGPLFVRMVIGSYFFMAGYAKLANPHGFVQVVKDMHLLPDQLATVYGVLLPYLEITAGSLLLLGLWTTLAASIIGLLLFSFIIAFGVFPARADIFNKDIVLLGAALSLLYTGAGMYSVDRFRKNG